MKCAIVTITNSNYGNRLQNYAVQEVLKKIGFNSVTIKNIGLMNKKKSNFEYMLRNVKHIFKKNDFIDAKEREKNFIEFNKNINFSSKTFNWFNLKWVNDFDFFIAGSDQIWNPDYRLTKFDLMSFTNNKKKISFSASFGVSELEEKYHNLVKNELMKYEYISLREDAGKSIVEKLTSREDIEVLVDPTMLLNASEWDKVSKKPEMLITNKYILNYFLGDLSYSRKKEIERIAKENNCQIINILDKNDPFYACGPSEFLYLEKNAFLICTDSFHSSVFAILYNRPFLVFDREDSLAKMNSRIETLISKFKLENRKYNEKEITKENIEHDYVEAYKILEKEREKSMNFLKKALNVNGSYK